MAAGLPWGIVDSQVSFIYMYMSLELSLGLA